jgi:hypothetical protein
MNSHEPQPGYPRSDLAVREIGEDDITDISRAFALIEDVWPELATEIRAYTRVVVPYAFEFQPVSATHYTAEHLLHESSHLRLMLLLAAPTTAPVGRSTAS